MDHLHVGNRVTSKRCVYIMKYVSLTFLKAAKSATQRALDPQIIPSEYCSPSFTMAGCRLPEELHTKH